MARSTDVGKSDYHQCVDINDDGGVHLFNDRRALQIKIQRQMIAPIDRGFHPAAEPNAAAFFGFNRF
mgnify:CR=1 FL=1